jgi:hypothetical protein
VEHIFVLFGISALRNVVFIQPAASAAKAHVEYAPFLQTTTIALPHQG